ncbi:hypothetical protein ACFV42_48140 [Streptomyces solisilvae]|uniref:hypothetical protein n=1 Tax=Streptomyces malaysiensis TaxID=92644 RepID=UPI0036995F4A
MHRVTYALAVCPASLRLTDADVTTYAAIPNPAYDPSGEQWCELSHHHIGDHAAEVQSADVPDRSYWVLWRDGEPYRIALLPNCTVTRPSLVPGEDPAVCLLYGAHGGDHDFPDED